MKKTNIILIIALIIITIALVFITKMYFDMRKSSELGLKSTLENANLLFEANKKIDELEKELEIYKATSSISTVTNSTTNNKVVSTEPYIPDGVKVAEPNDNSGIKASDIEYNRSPENVTIKVIPDTACDTSVQILITDNNEDKYGWGEPFSIQENVNGEWKDLDYVSDKVGWIAIAYTLNENNQRIQKVDIEEYYGKLDKGIYRVVKTIYDNGNIDLYSDEFEIK